MAVFKMGKEYKVRFDPYTDQPNKHFHDVTRKAFNEVNRGEHGINYLEYKGLAKDRSVGDVTKKEIKRKKKFVEECVNKMYKEGGVNALSEILPGNRGLEYLAPSFLFRDWENKDDLETDKKAYQEGSAKVVETAIKRALSKVFYPSRKSFREIRELFRGDTQITYKPESNLLVVDRPIPPPEEVPRRKKIKYVKSRDAFKSKDLSKRDFQQLYESIPYQVALRTIRDVFVLDQEAGEVIDAVVFNGWVTSVNPATGHEQTVCTISLQASREEIMSLNLERVDPEACFKNLKGVSASKLREKSPVTPIAQVDREDSRFTEERDVGEDLEGGENIAAMDWEDFEHLIRELFEREFEEHGGEVNVTQASRDGGIDAVVFDPDPLRGGKIVVQAKRYTRTVGVSAIRDLYGAVMDEGANKGILVTTADYGSEAYNFAKDKPLQLLNGGNLLSLLEEHGYDARIDVEEARKMME